MSDRGDIDERSLSVIADHPPVTAFLAPPATLPDGRLEIKLAAHPGATAEQIAAVIKQREAKARQRDTFKPIGQLLEGLVCKHK